MPCFAVSQALHSPLFAYLTSEGNEVKQTHGESSFAIIATPSASMRKILIMSLETKHIFASNIQAGEAIADVFFLASAQQGQAKNGPYWRLVLQDASGSIEGKIWSPFSQEYTAFDQGEPYWLAARAKSYRDKSELVISAIRRLGAEEKAELDLKDFLVTSPHDSDSMFERLRNLCETHISHPPLKRLVALLFADETLVSGLKMSPAAKAMHHAYAGGLLEHTLSVCSLAMKICDHYPGLDRQLLLAGALCHDLGKIWELNSGVAIDYTDEGRLLGHIMLGLEKLQPLVAASGLEPHTSLHLQHLVASHHGTLEFGSPKLPATAEALVLHYADNIDAKMQQVGNALAPLGEAQSGWSAYVTGLDRFVYRANITPSGQDSHQAFSSIGLDETGPATEEAVAPPAVDDFYAAPDDSYEAIAFTGEESLEDLALEEGFDDYFGSGDAEADAFVEPVADTLAVDIPVTDIPVTEASATDTPAAPGNEAVAKTAQPLETEGRDASMPVSSALEPDAHLAPLLDQPVTTPATPLPLIQQCSLLSKE